ncbi:COG1470 family protein [Thermococcus sp.]
MRRLVIVLAFLTGLMLVLGSSGNFRTYTSTRTFEFSVVNGNDSYVGYMCSPLVTLNASSGVEFRAVTVMNLMDKPISFYVTLNGSSLPKGLLAGVDNSVYTLEPGESMTVAGGFSADSYVPNGTYEVPLMIHAYWDGGSALIKDCSVFVKIVRPTYVLTKAIVGGRYTYRTGENYTVVMQLNFTNNGPEGNFIITDYIPMAGKNVVTHPSEPEPSKGVVDPQLPGCSCHCAGMKITWRVHVEHGETVTLEIPVQVFFSKKGHYTLNCGAHLCGTNVRSNRIVVKVVGGCSRC